jgi:hypothetical protein
MKIILCAGSNGRAVLIGDVAGEPVPGEPVEMTTARMVLYWDVPCGGLLGLAARGPKGDTRITAPVSRLVETVWQEWVTVDAAEAVDAWPAYE